MNASNYIAYYLMDSTPILLLLAVGTLITVAVVYMLAQLRGGVGKCNIIFANAHTLLHSHKPPLLPPIRRPLCLPLPASVRLLLLQLHPSVRAKQLRNLCDHMSPGVCGGGDATAVCDGWVYDTYHHYAELVSGGMHVQKSICVWIAWLL
ncbi:hypothetical protein EON65_34360 [archaeon]|nr:MAG: hypothetical protein EON65_34360 [archaeon]